MAKLEAELGQPIGTTASDLDSRRATVRGGEAAIGNLIADAMRAATGADVALFNGGGIRGDTTYPAGTALTRKMILADRTSTRLNSSTNAHLVFPRTLEQKKQTKYTTH